ncbi:hypothetical protein GQX74_005882 [Glossina fuscipes]|nr:hypothetical protein GQX74_005882 [Glossina fuscipes]
MRVKDFSLAGIDKMKFLTVPVINYCPWCIPSCDTAWLGPCSLVIIEYLKTDANLADIITKTLSLRRHERSLGNADAWSGIYADFRETPIWHTESDLHSENLLVLSQATNEDEILKESDWWMSPISADSLGRVSRPNLLTASTFIQSFSETRTVTIIEFSPLAIVVIACANISPRSESSPHFANNTANDVNTKITIFLGNVAYIYVSILIIYFCIDPKTTITNQEIIYCDYNEKDDKNTTNLKVAYDELEKRISYKNQ